MTLISEVEKALMIAVLAECRTVSLACKTLGMSRQTFYRRVKRYKIKLPPLKGRGGGGNHKKYDYARIRKLRKQCLTQRIITERLGCCRETIRLVMQ